MCALIRKQENAPFKEISLFLNMIVERHLIKVRPIRTNGKHSILLTSSIKHAHTQPIGYIYHSIR